MTAAMSSGQAINRKFGTRKLPGFCPRFHRAVELIGRRWTGAVIRALVGGPLRFNELLATVPGLSDRLLSERLRELEREHIVHREVSPGPPVRVEYGLTERGAELEPAIRAIAAWAERWIEAEPSA
jgi:DNA-binding HxlR family transcriptional regulator